MNQHRDRTVEANGEQRSEGMVDTMRRLEREVEQSRNTIREQSSELANLRQTSAKQQARISVLERDVSNALQAMASMSALLDRKQ